MWEEFITSVNFMLGGLGVYYTLKKGRIKKGWG